VIKGERSQGNRGTSATSQEIIEKKGKNPRKERLLRERLKNLFLLRSPGRRGGESTTNGHGKSKRRIRYSAKKRRPINATEPGLQKARKNQSEDCPRATRE